MPSLDLSLSTLVWIPFMFTIHLESTVELYKVGIDVHLNLSFVQKELNQGTEAYSKIHTFGILKDSHFSKRG